MPGEKPGSVRIEIKPVRTGGVDDIRDEDLEDEALRYKDDNWKETGFGGREPFRAMMDPGIVEDFLRGDYCLYGGTGWWKYEFCYGRKVIQYHEDAKTGKTVIELGSFVEENHLEWLKKHPSKRPKTPKEQRKSVSHFYTEGDLCDVTRKRRTVEVKLKCKSGSNSPSAVSLYLMEPRTCEYVLGVESPLVCDIIHQVDDQTGLVWVDQDDLDDEDDLFDVLSGKPEEPAEEEAEERIDNPGFEDLDGYAMYDGDPGDTFDDSDDDIEEEGGVTAEEGVNGNDNKKDEL